MADHCSLCILGVMDRLWFHQIILFSESSSPEQHTSLLTASSPVNLPDLSLSTSEAEILLPVVSSSSSESSAATSDQFNKDYVKKETEQEEQVDEVVNEKDRPTRSNLATNRFRSHSSSPSTHKRLRRNTRLRKVLQRSMSSRSLRELELEEVKGFMDLGFIFKKEDISPRLARIVPGLLRLGLFNHKQNNIIKLIDSEDLVTKVIEDENDNDDDNEQEIVRAEEEEEKGIIRPYLSEAWTIRRPDSPLLSLKLPRVSGAAEMKKHLKFWARTVASEIQQVC